MARNRKQATSIYSGLYSLFIHDPTDKFACFYCGEPADTVDHHPPVSRVSDYRSFKLQREHYVMVRSCSECNSVLGSELTPTILEREMLCKEKLAKRYKLALKTKQWTDFDIDEAELRGKLKRYVKGWSRYRGKIQQRIDYISGIDGYLAVFGNRFITQAVKDTEFENV